MTGSSAAGECRIAEILQYSCDEEEVTSGTPRFHCWPLIRIFRICPGRPAVELTRLVNVNSSTGAIELPSPSSQQLPKGKPWRDIKRKALANDLVKEST
ncbi:hypothetical protein K474DRAFT_1607774 [Panus rudis PR-1116 ss-1]|nr:hypothetical protein K474DRAFT_1608098 [Panus rudis PR-1116 ss-1]KAI0070935.1 hypothetical protein K474DRAFT_1607774 [Panus rudis PR-1116 ss-1]